jgi:hypothetical protein
MEAAVATPKKTKEKAKAAERSPAAARDWEDQLAPWPAPEPAGAVWGTEPRRAPPAPERAAAPAPPDAQHGRYGNAEVARVAAETHPSELEAQRAAAGGLPERGVVARPPSLGAPPPAEVQAALRGPGAPLDGATRDRMEGAIGTGLEDVRVHDDAAAARSAEGLGARAYTAGQDVVFAGGEYRPGTAEGDELLRHELTHVAQNEQAGEDADGHPRSISLSPFPVGPASPGTWAPPPVYPPPDPLRPPAPRDPVELLGTAYFAPTTDVADDIKNAAASGRSMWVAVKFGSLASGEIPVSWTGVWYQTDPPKPDYSAWPIQIHDEGFKVLAGARPALGITVDKSIVTGFVGWVTAAALAKDPRRFLELHPLSELFGWEGLTSEPEDSKSNFLSGGHLVFEQPAHVKAGQIKGAAHVNVYDEDYQFGGGLFLEVKGISDEILPLARDAANRLFAGKKFRFDRSMGAAGKLSGEIVGTFAGGIPDVRGTLSYRRSKPEVSGSVTVLLTSFDIAKEKVRDQLGADAPTDIKPADPDDSLAITGWGHVDFALNDWFTGNADVIVHPEGYVTAKGEIVPTVVIPILKKYETETDPPLFDKKISKAIPSLDAWVVDVAVVGKLKITGYASFGPGTMHDLRVRGLISTHPGIVNTFDFSGTISVPGVAGIKAVASASLAARVWLGKMWEAASVGLTIEGDLALQLYAEAAAAAGRRKAADGTPEYFLSGKLHGGAGLKLDLHMWLSADVAFWSKHVKLFDRAYEIAGASATIDFDYVFGRARKKDEDALKLSLSLGAFDQDEFAAAVLRGESIEDPKYRGKDQAEGMIEDVPPNPDAPIPVEPPDPTKPVPAGPPTGVPKTLDKAFDMLGAQHTLKLTLSDPPGLTMESVLEPLLKKVDRARKDAKKDASLGPDEKESRIAALDKIEASARGVQDAAIKAAKNPAYVTPQVPGFNELAQLIADYGAAYGVSDLGIALGKVAVDPSKPETVLNRFPGLASDDLVKAQVSRILANGVAATDLRKIVDNVRPVKEAEVLEVLGLIEKMIQSGAANWDGVITDLRIGGNKMKGARFVLRYVDTKLGWSDIGFELREDPLDTTGRRWDAWSSGTLYQFKSWYSWPDIANRTFLKQILQDYWKTHVGEDMALRWVFETSLDRADIVKKMKDALAGVVAALRAGQEPEVPGYTPGIALFIFARVDSIVVKA